MSVLDTVETEVPLEKLKELPRFSWTVRKCEEYKAELKECNSIKDRFHQHFIFGEFADCSQWNEDYQACLHYRKTGDLKSLENVIQSEQRRKEERLKGNIENDVWEKREEKPPPNWFRDLGGIEETKRKTSRYLGVLQREAKENPIHMPMYGTGCSIL